MLSKSSDMQRKYCSAVLVIFKLDLIRKPTGPGGQKTWEIPKKN